MKDETNKLKHPSYGMISAHRSNCSHDKNFYGSETKHNNFIVLEVHTSDVTRGLRQDWYYADRKLIQVALTPLQWAELLTTMNTSGVPCTLEYVNGEGRIDNPPELTDKVDLHKMEFEESLHDTLSRIKDALNSLETGIAEGKGKRVLREQLDKLKTQTQNLEPNMKFAINQFDKHVNKVLTENKQKIESLIEHKIITLGKEALLQNISEQIPSDKTGILTHIDSECFESFGSDD